MPGTFLLCAAVYVVFRVVPCFYQLILLKFFAKDFGKEGSFEENYFQYFHRKSNTIKKLPLKNHNIDFPKEVFITRMTCPGIEPGFTP